MKIALIAHDKKKDDIIKLAIKYKDVLKEHRLFATGTTGSLIMAETGLDIIRMKSGPLGGDQQIGSMIADGELDLVIFLRDPLTSQPHEPDVSALMRLCDVRNIPLATNKTSAAIMLKALSDGDIAEAGKGQLKNTAPKKNCVFIFAFFPSDGTHPSIDDASVIHPKHTLYVRLFYFQQIDSRTKIHYSTVAPIYFLIV